jgi:hypothetical protein
MPSVHRKYLRLDFRAQFSDVVSSSRIGTGIVKANTGISGDVSKSPHRGTEFRDAGDS